MPNADTPADQTGGTTAEPTSRLGELPPRIRVHALAKLLGQSSRDLLAKLAELGESPRSAASSVTREVAHQVAEALDQAAGVTPAADPTPAAGPAPATPATDEATARADQPAEAATAETPARPARTRERRRGSAARTAPEPEATPAAAAEPAEDGEAKADAPGQAVVTSPFTTGPAPADAAGTTGGKTARGGSRRGRRAVAPAIPAEQQEIGQATPARGPVHVPVFAAPSPVFLPPEEQETQPTTRSKPAPAEATEDVEDTAAEDTASEPRDERPDEDGEDANGRRRRRRGRRGRGRGKGGEEGADATEQSEDAEQPAADQGGKREDKIEQDEADSGDDNDADGGSKRRRRRRRRKGGDDDAAETTAGDDPPNTVTHVRQGKSESERPARDEVRSVRGSTRLEAKRQRRRDGREAGRRRAPILSEAEFLARREAVERTMVVAEKGDSTQIGVLEDGVLVEHFVTQSGTGSIVGNVYLGRVQNVLPSMEAAFIDIGRGRNAVLYAGEVDWDAAGLEGKARKIEQALSTGDSVLVQVTKDPVGHKGARLTTQISLPGRFLVYVPAGGATGISRKLPENERRRLKDILKRIVPEDAGVIIRTASEGISEEELDRDVQRLKAQWDVIKDKAAAGSGKKGGAPAMLYEEPDLLVKVVRDLFTEDFAQLEVQGGKAWDTIHGYVQHVAPDLTDRLKRYIGNGDAFADHRIDEQITKALDRKVWLPSGGYLVIDRTEAMTVIDVNTGKFTGSGGNLEETVTRNNLESAEEIVRQLRLRDIGGIIVIDFIDMVLESNRELVLRRLTECLGRDRTRHQVAEVTSLGLVQMTRKKIGTGLLEAFSTPCEHCKGRGVVVSTEPQRGNGGGGGGHNGNGHNHGGDTKSSRRSRGRGKGGEEQHTEHQAKNEPVPTGPTPEQRESVASAVQAMANASKAASTRGEHDQPDGERAAEPDRQPREGRGESAGDQPVTAKAPSAEPARRSATRSRRVASRAAGSAGPARELAGQPVTTAADEAEVRPAEPSAGPAREVADAPVTTSADETVVPQAEPAVAPSSPEPEPAEAPEAAAEPVGEPEVEVPAPAGRSGRRRSRRAASRPAGPPVHATDQS
ncbi:translation initiation factor IF-2 N-terminal domain-containing protein [Amycolatopsis panacis]|uniref:Ribonuclease E n=1 Tax=Amycolatopsis panacis TaxID=2340917 RepID=A0A419I5Z3_9PSEU|nr:translation initiation factor IF-2 N-terminal domain-containing protein [Amycolatopsis panacis]RJQ86419.1 Rne/Rng family ribonuclease [Amycolatopsis panacis]